MPFFSTLLYPATTPLAAPQPPTPTGCVPGHAGIPDSFIGEILCGTWGPKASDAVAHFLSVYGLALTVTAAYLVVLAVVTRVWRRRVWAAHAAQASWLRIVPPVTATPAATVALWRLLATALPVAGRWALRPPRMVWEVHAGRERMHVGLWLPPGTNPTAVARLVQRAWPGVRTEQATPPPVPGGTATTLAVLPTQPDWLPLVDDLPTTRFDSSRPEDDRLRAVYDGLAAAGRTGGGVLQVHISRAPAHRLRVLRRAMTHPERARRTRGASRAVTLFADAVRALILGVLNAVTPGPSGPKRRPGTSDPYLAELARQARAKHSIAPHLLVAVRAVAVGPTKAAALAAAADITSGYGLLGPHFTRRRVRNGPLAAVRWVPAARMSLASVAEAAALAGLPAEPAAYGLPGAASRRRTAGGDIFRDRGRSNATPATTFTPTSENPPKPGPTPDDPSTPWSPA